MKSFTRKIQAIIFFFLISFFSISCSDSHNLSHVEIDNAYIKLPLKGINSSAGYLTLKNKSKNSIELSGISCEASDTSSFHDTYINKYSGMMSMTKLDKLSIESGYEISFKPGGKHLMIEGLSTSINLGDVISCTIIFSNAYRLPIEFEIRK